MAPLAWANRARCPCRPAQVPRGRGRDLRPSRPDRIADEGSPGIWEETPAIYQGDPGAVGEAAPLFPPHTRHGCWAVRTETAGWRAATAGKRQARARPAWERARTGRVYRPREHPSTLPEAPPPYCGRLRILRWMFCRRALPACPRNEPKGNRAGPKCLGVPSPEARRPRFSSDISRVQRGRARLGFGRGTAVSAHGLFASMVW
jgi:hypothetical protein